MACHFEVVVFTAAMPDYADWILNSLLGDEHRDLVSHRLYRQHTVPCEDYAIKDLRLLGRKLEHTIIVDNLAENFQMTPDNGIWVESWYDDMDDSCLKVLGPFLAEMASSETPDVRKYLGTEVKERILYRHLE